MYECRCVLSGRLFRIEEPSTRVLCRELVAALSCTGLAVVAAGNNAEPTCVAVDGLISLYHARVAACLAKLVAEAFSVSLAYETAYNDTVGAEASAIDNLYATVDCAHGGVVNFLLADSCRLLGLYRCNRRNGNVVVVNDNHVLVLVALLVLLVLLCLQVSLAIGAFL